MLFYGTAFTALFVLLPRLDALNNSAALNFEPIAVLFLAWPILGQSIAPLHMLIAITADARARPRNKWIGQRRFISGPKCSNPLRRQK